MKKGTKCIVQTINLSNPKTCVRPKVQRRVSADGNCSSEPNRAIEYCTSRPVTVKICSRRDAQRKCPPKSCERLEELPSLSSKAKLGKVATFFVKGAIVAGLICWTCTEGLWGDSTETEDLYYRMMSAIFPDLPDRSTQLPHLEGMKYSAAEAYNHMLVKGMDIIVSVPREVHRRLRDLLFPCDTTKKTERKAIHSENSADL